MDRKYKLEKFGFTVREVWECAWQKALKQNPRLKSKWNETFVAPAFHPRRHALFGGRVEAFKLFEEIKAGEVIEHFDIVCLKIKFFINISFKK